MASFEMSQPLSSSLSSFPQERSSSFTPDFNENLANSAASLRHTVRQLLKKIEAQGSLRVKGISISAPSSVQICRICLSTQVGVLPTSLNNPLTARSPSYV